MNGERRPLVVRLDPIVLTRLRMASAERDLSMSFLANQAIRRYLDNLPPIGEIVREHHKDRTVGF